MTDAIQFISNNNIASALVVAAILAIIGGAWKWRVIAEIARRFLVLC